MHTHCTTSSFFQWRPSSGPCQFLLWLIQLSVCCVATGHTTGMNVALPLSSSLSLHSSLPPLSLSNPTRLDAAGGALVLLVCLCTRDCAAKVEKEKNCTVQNWTSATNTLTLDTGHWELVGKLVKLICVLCPAPLPPPPPPLPLKHFSWCRLSSGPSVLCFCLLSKPLFLSWPEFSFFPQRRMINSLETLHLWAYSVWGGTVWEALLLLSSDTDTHLP